MGQIRNQVRHRYFLYHLLTQVVLTSPLSGVSTIRIKDLARDWG